MSLLMTAKHLKTPNSSPKRVGKKNDVMPCKCSKDEEAFQALVEKDLQDMVCHE